MENNFTVLTKSILFISISAFFLVLAYLAYSNPNINHNMAKKIRLKENAIQEVRRSEEAVANVELKKWKWFNLSDVAADNDKYPMVVLRTGFKLIKIEGKTALLGWRMDVANTSKENSYSPNIEYTITDEDDFGVASSSGSVNVSPQSFGTVRKTLSISKSNLDRVGGDTWTISIGLWQSNEKHSEGKRYERLAEMVKDPEKAPYWLAQTLEEDKLAALISDKWKVIEESITAKPEQNQHSDLFKDFPSVNDIVKK